jgi:hypothetical protein
LPDANIRQADAAAVFASDFRWIIDREDTPWYQMMRLFHQARNLDWQTPLAKLVEEVRSLAAGGNTT